MMRSSLAASRRLTRMLYRSIKAISKTFALSANAVNIVKLTSRLCILPLLFAACGPSRMMQQVEEIKVERQESLRQREASVAALRRDIVALQNEFNSTRSSLNSTEKRDKLDAARKELQVMKEREQSLLRESAEL